MRCGLKVTDGAFWMKSNDGVMGIREERSKVIYGGTSLPGRFLPFSPSSYLLSGFGFRGKRVTHICFYGCMHAIFRF